MRPFVDAAVRVCKSRIEDHEISLSQQLNSTCLTPEDADLDFRGPIEEAMRVINNFAGVTESVRRSELWQVMFMTTRSGLIRFADGKESEYLEKLQRRQYDSFVSALEREVMLQGSVVLN